MVGEEAWGRKIALHGKAEGNGGYLSPSLLIRLDTFVAFTPSFSSNGTLSSAVACHHQHESYHATTWRQ